MKTSRLRVFLAEAGTLAISAIGFTGLKIPYSSPTDVLLTLAMGGSDGAGAPQYLCSYHMNTLFNYLLYLLQRLTGVFNIFGWTLITLFTLSFCLLQLTAEDRKPMVHLLIAVMQILCLTHFTYTVVAYIAMGAGLLCRASAEKKSRILCCWFLMLSGASLRYDVIITAVVLLMPTLIFHLLPVMSATKLPGGGLPETEQSGNELCRAGKEKTPRKKHACKGPVFMCAAALFLWIAVSMVINPMMYKAHGTEWAGYYSYDRQSLRIRDGQAIDYDKYQDVMQQVGWSENDLKMARSWLFTDADVFGTGSFRKVADALELTDKLNLRIPSILSKFFTTPMAVGFLFVSLLALVFAARRVWLLRKTGSPYFTASWWYFVLVLLPAALLPCMLWAALYVRQRFVDRVAIPFLVLGILQFAELFEAFLSFDSQNIDLRCSVDFPHPAPQQKKNAAVLTALILLFCIVAVSQIRDVSTNAVSSKDRQLFNQYLEEHNDITFLTVSGILNKMTGDIPIIAVSKEAAYGNVIRLGSQLTFSENYYNGCRQCGISDPDHLMKNLISGGRPVMLLALSKSDAEKIRIFLAEHYGYTGEYTAVAEISPGITVYKY